MSRNPVETPQEAPLEIALVSIETTQEPVAQAPSIDRIEDLDYTPVPFSNFSSEQLPPLPVGLWHEGKRLTTYAINPAIASSLDGSNVFSEALLGIENRNITDEQSRITSFAKWLGGISLDSKASKTFKKVEPVLLSIGGIPLKDLALAQSKSVEDLITSLAYKDIAVISLAVRLVVNEDERGYIVEQKCEVAGCPLGKKDTIKLQASLDELIINYPEEPPFSSSYRIGLDTGIKYKDARLESVYLGYAKLYQVPKLMAIRGNGKAETMQMIDLLATGIPDLPDFIELKKTKRLSEALSAMSIKDCRKIMKAFDTMDKLGCNTQFDPVCSCYREESIPLGFAWMRWSGIYGVLSSDDA